MLKTQGQLENLLVLSEKKKKKRIFFLNRFGNVFQNINFEYSLLHLSTMI